MAEHSQAEGGTQPGLPPAPPAALPTTGALRIAARPAEDLQAQFEVLPPAGEHGWLGGDSDVSVVINGGKSGRRALWIFADTFIGRHCAETRRRVKEGSRMPNSSVALIEADETGGFGGRPRYHWRRDADGHAVNFFTPPAERAADGEIIWPVSGIASRDGRSVLLLAQRIKGFLNVIGTSAIVIRDTSPEDPCDWQCTLHDVGTAELTWFSAVFFAERAGDVIYVFGHEKVDGHFPPASTVLARASLADLLDQDWSRAEYWSRRTWSKEPRELTVLGLPSWETTCNWCEELGLWYTFHIEGFGTQVEMHTAREVTGAWFKHKVCDIPEPFGRDPGKPWICYAAKAHPEHHRQPFAEGGEVELVLSWVSNAMIDPNDPSIAETGGLLFDAGGMHLPNRGYWPMFLRVTVASHSDANSCN